MPKSLRSTIAGLLCAASCAASAATVDYTFSTLAASPGGFGSGASFLTGALAGTSVSGGFGYDAAALATAAAPDGSTIYGGAASPFSGLSGAVGGFAFSDPRGFMVLGNDRPISVFASADSLQMIADPQSAGAGVHNLSGFSLGAYTLSDVRLFWISGSTTPETIPDFLSSQALPGALPSFHGRLALDFVETANPTGAFSSVFYDGVAVTPVPEPEIYAMMAAGLGLLGFTARRRLQAAG